MKTTLLALLLLSPLFLLSHAFAQVQGAGVIDAHRDALATPEGSRPLVLKGGLNGVAQTAFGMCVSGGEKIDAKLAIAFANRSGMFNEAVLTIAANNPDRIRAWADALIQAGPYGQRLAAAVLLAHTQGELVAKRKNSRIVRYKGDNPKFKKAGAKRGGKKGGAAAKRGKLTIPEGLISKTEPNTAAMAILAAAYAKDKSVAEAVKARPNALRILGAKNLYLAAIGETVDASDLQKGLGARDKFITSPGRDLLDLQLALPDASTTCEAIAAMKDPAHLPLAMKATTHPDLRVQIEAVRAIKAINDPSALPALAKMLGSCSWPVLIEVADALGQMPDKRAIQPLVNRLAKERGRMREDLVHCLGSIAGEYHGGTAQDWVSWWRTNGERFTVDPAATKTFRTANAIQDAPVPTTLYFYGLKIHSDRFSFVIDSSASMKGMRIYSLRKNLYNTCNAMKPYINYNIVDFGGDVCVMYPGTLTTDKKLGMDRALTMPMTLGTRTYEGIDMAFGLPGLDTIILLTDGAPVRSKAKKWGNMMLGWNMKCRYQPVALLAVDFDPSAGNQASMIRFVCENVGQHESIHVADEDMNEPKFIRKGDASNKKKK